MMRVSARECAQIAFSVLSALVLTCAGFACALGATAQPVVAAYYGGGMPTVKIPADQLTDIIYAFGEPDSHDLCPPADKHQRADFAQLRGLRVAHPRLRLWVS